MLEIGKTYKAHNGTLVRILAKMDKHVGHQFVGIVTDEAGYTQCHTAQSQQLGFYDFDGYHGLQNQDKTKSKLHKEWVPETSNQKQIREIRESIEVQTQRLRALESNL